MSGTPSDIMSWADGDPSKIVALLIAYVLAYALLVVVVRWTGRAYRLYALRNGIRLTVSLGCGASGVLNATGLGLLHYLDQPYDQDQAWFLVSVTALAGGCMLLAISAAYTLGAVASSLVTPKVLRAVLKEPPPPEPEAPGGDEGVHGPEVRAGYGIALAGGGIRSASLALGALQVLERATEPGPKMGWNNASRVTAISGGSNMAAGWSLSRSKRTCTQCGEVHEASPDAWAAVTDEKVSPEEKHLRRNLSYLLAAEAIGEAPGLTSDKNLEMEKDKAKQKRGLAPAALVTVFVGMMTNVLVLLAIMWVVTRPLGWLYRELALLASDVAKTACDKPEKLKCLVGSTAMWVPPVAWLAVGVVFLVLWVVLAKLRPVAGLLKIVRGVGYGALAIGLVLGVVLVLFPGLMRLVGDVETPISIGAMVASLASYAAVVRVLQKPITKYAATLGGVAFFVAVTMIGALWTYNAAVQGPGEGVQLWLGMLILIALAWASLSSELWSIAAFYRGKLRQAFATYTVEGGPDSRRVKAYRNDTAIDRTAAPEPELHTFRDEDGVTTPLTICAASTVSSRSVRTHHGIPALSVTFDPKRVTVHLPDPENGKWGEWSASSKIMNDLRVSGSRLTTMFASAVASAAVAPGMGRVRLAGPTRMLLTFANVRTGAWIPNPRYAALLEPAELSRGRLRRTRMGYLIKEALGIFDPSDLFIYVSDGGHWENTGIVELLRDRTRREIVCIDADMGPPDTATSVAKAIELAQLECGVTVHLDIDPLRAAATGAGAPGYSERTVNLGFFESSLDNSEIGLLWYAKPGLVAGMPAPLLAHREIHHDFPRTSTSDQFFDLATFSAYRDLGRYNARVIRQARFELERAVRKAKKFRNLSGQEEMHWACAELIHFIHSTSVNEQGEKSAEARQRRYAQVRQLLAETSATGP